jgi:N-acetylmuramoyl-L-alanine amidase
VRNQPAVLIASLIVVFALTSCATHSVLTDGSPGLDRIAETWNERSVIPDTTGSPLTIVYPRGEWPDSVFAPGDSVLEGAIPPDSLFLFGSVADPKGKLSVNGVPVPIHPGGGWLAWVPRGPVETLTPPHKLVPGKLATVTIRYDFPSHEQNSYTKRILFLDKPDTPAMGPYGFVAEPTRLIVSVDNAKIRCGWPGTYDMFPPRGTVLFATGRDVSTRTMWKVPLGGGTIGWIEDIHVEKQNGSAPLPLDVIHSVVANVEETPWERSKSTISIPLSQRKPFRVRQVADDCLELTIYGAMSWTDLIIQPHGSRAVDELRWTQTDSTTWTLTAFIDSAWFLGWETSFDADADLIWTIHENPEIASRPFKGLRILLDPGHGGTEYSAIGPTGLPEKTVNLWLARALTRELENAGAEVIPTRTEDITYGLFDRVVYAAEQQPDLIISLHHNALAQGVNPEGHHGASVHYNHRHSHALAESIYGAVLGGGWPGNGLRYQDLAMARPTQCPAVLLEAGFMMQPGEEALFRTQEYHQDMARWVRIGLENYFNGVREAQRDD